LVTEETPTVQEDAKPNTTGTQNTQAQQTQTASASREPVSPMMKLIAERRGKEALKGGEEEAVRREIAATAVEMGRLQNQITAASTDQERKLAEAAFQAYINDEATKNFLMLLRQRDPGNPLFIILEKYERENKEILEAKNASDTELWQLKRYLTAGAFTLATVLLLGGGAVYFAVSNHRKKKQLLAATQQLEAEQERLKALNNELKTLTEIVAHDLKAPLNKVVGLTQLLPLVGTLNEEQSKYIGMVNQVAHDGRQFIENLLDVKAIEEQKRRLNNAPLEVVEWLNRSLAGYEQTAHRKNIKVHLEHTGQSWIEADKSAFGQVLDNLVSNAIKFSPPDRNVYIRVETGYSLISIAIRDEGPGISEEDQQKMFKKFQRLSARPTAGEHSSGLGLSIVKLLVEQMNGEIHLDSEVGRGSTFTVYFHKHVPEVSMTQETAA
jgi:signal transduction histidine kinase